MKWIEVSIATTSSGAESVEAQLLIGGVSGWQIIDPDEMRRFLAENPMLWDYADDSLFEDSPEYVIIRFYAADNEHGRAMIETVKTGLDSLKKSLPDADLGSLAISLEQVDDESWPDSWKKYFKPFGIGKNIVIRPEWEEYSQEGKTVVAVEPGHMFGTGLHETTRMCIEALEQYIKPGDTMLDLGCGSGILAVTGIVLGAAKCVAVDINPEAAGVTYNNAELNGISGEKLHVHTGDIINSPALQEQVSAYKYDCITANIVADVIIPLSELTAKMNCIKPGGTLIASGIILERLDEVLAAFLSSGFSIVETLTAGGWACVVVK